MKKHLGILILFFVLYSHSFAQENIEHREITNSVSADFMSFQLMNSSTKLDSYEALNTNSTFDGTIDINFPIFKNSEITSGLGLNYRFGDAYLENLNEVRVSEYFIRIPVNYKYFLFTKSNTMIPFLGIGTYLDILGSQTFYFKDNATKPIGYKDSYGFGSYFKSGLSTSIGFRFQTNDQISLDFGMKGHWDLAGLFLNPDNMETYDYSAYGLYFSIIFL